MNDKNLIRFDQMSSECHRELSRRGGVASSATRRKKAEEKRLKLESRGKGEEALIVVYEIMNDDTAST